MFVIADLAKLQQMEEQANREGEEKEEEKKGEEEEKEGVDRFGGALGDDDWLDGHDDGDGRPDVDDAVKDSPMDGEGTYLLQSLPTKELVFTEVLPNKRHTTVLEALRCMVARIAGLGYKIHRVHSDKGQEFMAKSVQRWASARGFLWSNTGGDNWKSNGRVESCIGRLKGTTTTLLSCAGLPRDDWPFAWRHGAERLLRNVLFDLGGVESSAMVPFGTKLLVRQRAWRISDWTPKAVPAVILAPARQVSKAWLVRTETGEYLTTAVIFPSIIEPPSKPEAQQGSATEEGAAIPGRRYREKTSVALLGPFEDPDSALASPNDADDEGSALKSPGAEQERALCGQLRMDVDCPQVASCVICEVPGSTRVSGEIWEIPRGCSSNEELIRCEDAVAQSLANDPTYSLSRACEFVRRSLWGRMATNVLKGARRTELQRVLGLFRHGGVVGITNSTSQFPGVYALDNQDLPNLLATAVFF